eukprot:scaffold387_cov400-Pavlova_lutheri.AAC.1
MSGEYPHSLEVSSTAKDHSVYRDRSSSVSNTAGMGIALRGPQGGPIFLEGYRPKFGPSLYGIRPPRNQGWSSLNKTIWID